MPAAVAAAAAAAATVVEAAAAAVAAFLGGGRRSGASPLGAAGGSRRRRARRGGGAYYAAPCGPGWRGPPRMLPSRHPTSGDSATHAKGGGGAGRWPLLLRRQHHVDGDSAGGVAASSWASLKVRAAVCSWGGAVVAAATSASGAGAGVAAAAICTAATAVATVAAVTAKILFGWAAQAAAGGGGGAAIHHGRRQAWPTAPVSRCRWRPSCRPPLRVAASCGERQTWRRRRGGLSTVPLPWTWLASWRTAPRPPLPLCCGDSCLPVGNCGGWCHTPCAPRRGPFLPAVTTVMMSTEAWSRLPLRPLSCRGARLVVVWAVAVAVVAAAVSLTEFGNRQALS